MTKKQKEIYVKTMKSLSETWNQDYEELKKLHFGTGIRSTQIGALVIFLIETGVLK